MIKKNDLKIRIVITLGFVILSAWSVFPLQKKINLGLDLRGGMYVLLRADTSAIEHDKRRDAINAAVEKLDNRINAFGVTETTIRPQGNDSILVEIPGIVDQSIVNTLKGVGKLEFKLVDDSPVRLDAELKGKVPDGYELSDYKNTPVLLHKEASLIGSDLDESYAGVDEIGLPAVNLSLTNDGRVKFGQVTEKNKGKLLAIILDGKVMSAPRINEPIWGGKAIITGNFTPDETRALISVLNSGALPVPLSVDQQHSVGPTLGSDSISRGIKSIVLGAVLVVVFILVYYLVGGFIAVICLALDLLFILAGLYMFRGTLTLPGIAGMILTLGMAVDANVLIFERIREEIKLQRPLSIAFRNGFDRAKRTIFDANITTLIAAFALYIFGSGPIKGFATTLSLGIVASIFTAVFVSRTIFALLLEMKIKRFPMLRLFSSPNINFVGFRNFCVVLSAVLVIVGLVNFYSKKENIYGIDFKGGQKLEYKLVPPQEIGDVRLSLQDKGFEGLVIQEFNDIDGGVIIKSKEDVAVEVENALKDKFKNVESLSVDTISPRVGKILKQKAILAILVALFLILGYVAFRFKHFDFAIAAVIALFHDVLITLGAISFAGYEISLLTITALLTIAGYSINDTIVIYDRIREISPKLYKLPLKERINIAINNTLSRTIITSFTTLMVVFSIYLLGGEALSGFSFALLVGIVAGTYSSVYIASPLVLLFRKPHPKK